MFSRIKKQFDKLRQPGFVNHSLFYVFTSLFSAVLSFLTLFILSRHLPVEDMGQIETFTTIGTLVQVFLLWGNEAVLINYYSKYGNKHEFANSFRGVLRHSIIAILVLFVIGLIFKIFDFLLLLAAFIWAFLNSFKQIIRVSFQLEARVISFMIIELSVSAITLLLCIVLLRINETFYVRLIASVVAVLLVLCYFMPSFYKNKVRQYVVDKQDITSFYKNGSALAISDFSSWGIERVDRLQVVSSLGMSNLGVYSIATQFSMGATMIGAAISRAWQPYVIRYAETNRNAVFSNIVKISCGMFALILAMAVFVYFFIKLVMSSDYTQSASVAIVLCVGYAFDGIWKLYNNILVYENKFKVVSMIIVFLALFKLVLNFFLIPLWGLYGAALTAVLVYFGGFLISSMYVHMKLKWFSTDGAGNIN